jgi:S1-C subfamily serine protease
LNKRFACYVGLAVAFSLLVGAGCANLQPTKTPVPTQLPTQAPAPTAVPLAQAAQPSSSTANQLEDEIEAVFQEAGPAVVNITSRMVVMDMFMQSVPEEGTGSGFVYDRQGHIVTNYHVVENAESISVAFATGESYPATVVGQDPSTDLAVLQVEAPNLPDPLAVGDSSQLRVGQFVVAIGNPFQLERTLTLGIISALQRVIQSPDGRFIGEAIQTDAAINPGNSGGPMLNLAGEVIGVNSQIISPSGAYAGIGFAISSNTVRRIVPVLIANGSFPHPWLGVNILALTADVIQALQQAGVDPGANGGVLILNVVSGSPAAASGLRGGSRQVQFSSTTVPVGGDVITAINGQQVATGQDLTTYLDAQTKVGDSVELTVIRDGNEQKISVTLGEMPSQ